MKQQLKTVNIKGKEYVEVSTRLRYFRENYTQWSLQAEIVSLSSDEVCMVARIYDENGHIRAVGHAHEEKKASRINAVSFVENCETSAWGRALANLGIGIDASVASANEVSDAIKNQEVLSTQQSSKQSLKHQVEARLNGAAEEVNAFLRSVDYCAEEESFADLSDDKLRYILDNAESLLSKAKAHALKGSTEVRKAVAKSVAKGGAQ